jgi:hypothetical protein
MTLNITVLTRESIYQSADLRLTDVATGAVITDRSGKTVSFAYAGWLGFVTYTGLGSWDGRAVSQHMANWMGDGVTRTMSEVANRLAQEGTKLLADVRRQTRRQIPIPSRWPGSKTVRSGCSWSRTSRTASATPRRRPQHS